MLRARDLMVGEIFLVKDRFDDAVRTYIFKKIAIEIESFRQVPVERIRTTHTRDDGTVVFDFPGKRGLSYIDALHPVSREELRSKE
jgi:hypothetical protein